MSTPQKAMFFFSSFVLFFSSNVQRFLNQEKAKLHKIRSLDLWETDKYWVYDFYSPLIYIYIYIYISLLFICMQHIMPRLYEFKIFGCNLRRFRPSFVGGATTPETLIRIMWSQHVCRFEETAFTPLQIWLESLSHLSRHGFKHTFQK